MMKVEIWCEADPMEGYELAWEGVLPSAPMQEDTITNLEFKDTYHWVVSPGGRSWDFNPDLGAVVVQVYCKPEEWEND